MTIFIYDKTWEGLLTALFDAYARHSFPDMLIGEGETLPLFYEDKLEVRSDAAKCDRVWKGLSRRISPLALNSLTAAWLSELPGCDMLLFRYMRQAIDAPATIEYDFGNPVVLEIGKICKRVHTERCHVVQFLRFQKAADGTFFAPIEPIYNVLPLTISYLKDRFSDQPWIVYDVKRCYGYYNDLKEIRPISFEEKPEHLVTGRLDESLISEDELYFQKLWKEYFNAIAIKERMNPRLHRQLMPARFWKYLPEKY